MIQNLNSSFILISIFNVKKKNQKLFTYEKVGFMDGHCRMFSRNIVQ